MNNDPAHFPAMTVSDTCAVWNILSSPTLYRAVKQTKLHFCVTPMVQYECLQKPRKIQTPEKTELMGRLSTAQKEGGFPIQGCELEDLIAVVGLAPKGLGAGELSCIAVAYQIRTFAFMTDEKKARHFAEKRLDMKVQTTPMLYSHLHFRQHLNDGDHAQVIEEHERVESRPLTPYFQKAYEHALYSRYMMHQSSDKVADS